MRRRLLVRAGLRFLLSRLLGSCALLSSLLLSKLLRGLLLCACLRLLLCLLLGTLFNRL